LPAALAQIERNSAVEHDEQGRSTVLRQERIQMSQELTHCKRCKKQIIFLPTQSGKLAPVDAETVAITDEVFDAKKHTSHFATCRFAAEFRKPKNKKGSKQ
jgi:hypothetical protein